MPLLAGLRAAGVMDVMEAVEAQLSFLLPEELSVP